MLKSVTTFRVRYADTDQMKFAYNGKYFEYLEIGRTEMMREIGLTYKELEESGFLMPVIEAKINYLLPAFYDELLEVESIVPYFPEVRLHIDHNIKSIDRNVVISRGYIKLAFINIKTMKPTRAPKNFIDAISKYFKNEVE